MAVWKEPVNMVAREQTSYLKFFPILMLRILQHGFILNVIVTHVLVPSFNFSFQEINMDV